MDAVLVEVAMMRESFVCFSDGCIVHAALNGNGATLTFAPVGMTQDGDRDKGSGDGRHDRKIMKGSGQSQEHALYCHTGEVQLLFTGCRL